MASGKRQRTLATNIAVDNMEAEKGAFLFSKDGGEEEIKEALFVYTPNLMRKVADLLQHNQQ